MTRLQRLFFSALLALMMALHATEELLEPLSSDPNWLRMVGVGVSAVVSAAALGLFLRSLATQVDGQPFLGGGPGSRRRSIWPGIGAVILCLLGASLVVVLARSMGIGSDRIGRYLDTVAAVWFPLVGSLALVWLLRKAPAERGLAGGGGGGRA